jgi:hypothetical protein
MKTVTITDFLNEAEINACLKLWNEHRPDFHRRVVAEIITPNMARINADLGQENDPNFLAYAVEYVLTHLQ